MRPPREYHGHVPSPRQECSDNNWFTLKRIPESVDNGTGRTFLGPFPNQEGSLTGLSRSSSHSLMPFLFLSVKNPHKFKCNFPEIYFLIRPPTPGSTYFS